MSSEKREMQKKNREKAVKKAAAKKNVIVVVCIVIAAVLLGGIGYIVYYQNVCVTKSIEEYSRGLNDDGTIKDVNVSDYVTLCDYENITVAYDELVPTQEEMDAKITNLLSQHEIYNTDAGTKIKMGDKINMDYDGKIEGVAFEGSSTQGNGTTITVGQANYIDDFEEQLVGKKVGDTFDVAVTFPEDYGQELVNGKDAVFTCTINGIYTLPEFDDAFVKEYYSDVANSAQAYKDYLKQQDYETALNEYIQNYIKENSTVNAYPEKYVKILKGMRKYNDEQNYEYYNNYYYSNYGSYLYKTFDEYTQMSKKEYEANLVTQAQTMAGNAMIIQAIYEKAGLTVSQENLNTVLTAWGSSATYYNQMEEYYGAGYIYQAAMSEAVMSYLKENVTVTK